MFLSLQDAVYSLSPLLGLHITAGVVVLLFVFHVLDEHSHREANHLQRTSRFEGRNPSRTWCSDEHQRHAGNSYKIWTNKFTQTVIETSSSASVCVESKVGLFLGDNTRTNLLLLLLAGTMRKQCHLEKGRGLKALLKNKDAFKDIVFLSTCGVSLLWCVSYYCKWRWRCSWYLQNEHLPGKVKRR